MEQNNIGSCHSSKENSRIKESLQVGDKIRMSFISLLDGSSQAELNGEIKSAKEINTKLGDSLFVIEIDSFLKCILVKRTSENNWHIVSLCARDTFSWIIKLIEENHYELKELRDSVNSIIKPIIEKNGEGNDHGEGVADNKNVNDAG